MADGSTDVIAAAESDAAAETKVRTATGDAEYNDDWNGIGSSDDPALATLRLLHTARQMVDTSRWWTLQLAEQCNLTTRHCLRLKHRGNVQAAAKAAQGDGTPRSRTLCSGDGQAPCGG